ncbi:hypothetical protein [Streptomyces sp. V1I1]|uniref:hypothetical protein n=1 Tax=Streptomyces sp. V1I1 TaxID=3042272 RepID=UPI00277EA15D|nr:hypothetical protein [Streptomyces sp. V1I1]MDQ0938307.1 hypothetical protein [Streptomyces sp. V1I1]
MVWFQGDSDNHVRWSRDERQFGLVFQWPGVHVLDDRRASSPPSIARVGHTTYMAWKGANDDKHIYWSTLSGYSGPLSDHPATWSPQQSAHWLQTDTFPTLSPWNGRLLMYWKRYSTNPDPYSNDRRMVWSELVDGQWTSPTEFDTVFRGVEGVAAAVHQGRRYLAWRGRGTDTRIHWHWFDGGHAQDGAIADDQHTNALPSLVSDGTTLHMAWRNTDDDHISWSTLTGPPEAPRWRPRQVLNDRRTAGSPTLGASDPGSVIMVWAGAAGDSAVWWSRFTNGQWGQQYACTDRHLDSPMRVGLL